MSDAPPITATDRVFISYAREDIEFARDLAAKIDAHYGSSTAWYDREVLAHGPYPPQIEAALEASSAVVVIWSNHSRQSEWVLSEANKASSFHKLVHTKVPHLRWTDVPSPYDVFIVHALADASDILRNVDAVRTGIEIDTRNPLYSQYRAKYGRDLIDPKTRAIPDDPDEVSPTELLQAKYELVDYIDVSGQLERLMQWCINNRRKRAGCLLYGAGGVGKTRLLINLALRLRAQGWLAGFYDRAHSQSESFLALRRNALDQLIFYGGGSGLLIVIDYAEAREEDIVHIAERLDTYSAASTRPIRLVLLSRTAGDWWTHRLHGHYGAVLRLFHRSATEAEVVALPALETARERIEFFQLSRQAFEPHLVRQGFPPADDALAHAQVERIHSGEGHSRPLALQMEALLSQVRNAPEGTASGIDELLSRILQLESRHWRKHFKTLDDYAFHELQRGIAQVTLLQGVSDKLNLELLLLADEYYGARRQARIDVADVVNRICSLYERSDGSVGALEPDLVGEHLVAQFGDTEIIDGCLMWTATQRTESRSVCYRNLLAVLQRASQVEHGSAATSNVSRLLRHLIDNHTARLAAHFLAVILETPGALLSHLIDFVEEAADEELAAIDSALPARSVALIDLAVNVAERRVALAQAVKGRSGKGGAAGAVDQAEEERNLAQLASRFGALGVRLSNQARHDEAGVASGKALDIYRRLNARHPGRYLADIANNLNTLGADLFGLRQYDEALDEFEKSLKIRRKLPHDNETDQWQLSSSIHNVGAALSRLTRREEGVKLTEEAVGIRRRLAKKKGGISAPLARSLHNLSTDLSELGRFEEALKFREESVELRRQLAEHDPDSHDPDLANSLHLLADNYWNVQRRDAALKAIDQAVEIRERLTEAQPRVFGPQLAASLNQSATYRLQEGKSGAALAVCRQSVRLWQELAKSDVDDDLEYCAAGLHSSATLMLELESPEDACAAFRHCVDVREQLAGESPQGKARLATSLKCLGGALGDLNRFAEARVPTERAVSLYRDLVNHYGLSTLTPELASSLNDLAAALYHQSLLRAAEEACNEAVNIRRDLVAKQPDEFKPDLARSLYNLAVILQSAGEYDQARYAALEAAELEAD